MILQVIVGTLVSMGITSIITFLVWRFYGRKIIGHLAKVFMEELNNSIREKIKDKTSKK